MFRFLDFKLAFVPGQVAQVGLLHSSASGGEAKSATTSSRTSAPFIKCIIASARRASRIAPCFLKAHAQQKDFSAALRQQVNWTANSKGARLQLNALFLAARRRGARRNRHQLTQRLKIRRAVLFVKFHADATYANEYSRSFAVLCSWHPDGASAICCALKKCGNIASSFRVASSSHHRISVSA